jgi:hypothetical protein
MHLKNEKHISTVVPNERNAPQGDKQLSTSCTAFDTTN